MWQRYETRWRNVTSDRLDLQLLELMPPPHAALRRDR
jgi:hypothetical protein